MRSLLISLPVRNPFYNLTHSFGAWKQEKKSWAILNLIIQHVLYQFFSDEKDTILSAQKNHFFGFIIVLIQFVDTLNFAVIPQDEYYVSFLGFMNFCVMRELWSKKCTFSKSEQAQYSIRIRAKNELAHFVSGSCAGKLWTNHFFQVGNCSLWKSRGKATLSLLEMCLWNGYFW